MIIFGTDCLIKINFTCCVRLLKVLPENSNLGAVSRGMSHGHHCSMGSVSVGSGLKTPAPALALLGAQQVGEVGGRRRRCPEVAPGRSYAASG